MPTVRLGRTDLETFPICLGGNVFGWSLDERSGFVLLDAYAAAGGNFIDTADVYMARLPGNEGGESESIIGSWMASRGNRDRMVIATKVGMWKKRPGLSADNIRAAADDSLRRLQTDHVDLYYAHQDDPDVPLEETLGAFDDLVRAGKVRYLGASNHTAPRLAEALETSERCGLASYSAVQLAYSLVRRTLYEGDLEDLCARRGLAVITHSSLASGVLTGKYDREAGPVDTARREIAERSLDDLTHVIVDELRGIAAARRTTIAAIALAWLRAKPTVATPIASARTTRQLEELLPGAELELTSTEVATLDRVSLRFDE